MGAIKLYGKLYEGLCAKQPEVVKQPEEVFAGQPILADAKEITLAEFDVKTKDAITAHHLKDYRRKRFNLILLPKIDILFDNVLEGSDYWSGLLNNESAYS